MLILFVCMHAAAAGYLAGAGRPPTLEIFPSWPMRHQQQLHSVKAPPPLLPISHDQLITVIHACSMHARIHSLIASLLSSSPLALLWALARHRR